MLDFMVIALPRSGTTWVSNWLTSDKVHCIHDPLAMHRYNELDNIKSDKVLGISCTAIFTYKDYLKKHPAKKLILHRDIDEINTSLVSAGMSGIIHSSWQYILDDIEGLHIPWTDLFNHPKEIYEYLTGLPFDEERYIELRQMHIEPYLTNVSYKPKVLGELLEHYRRISCQSVGV